MSRFASPIPVSTAIADAAGQLTLPFRTWLHRLGQDWVQANRTTPGKDAAGAIVPGFATAVNGNLVSLSYQGPGAVLALPFPAIAPAVVVAVSGATVDHLTIATGATSLDLSGYSDLVTLWGQYISKQTEEA